MDTTPNDFRSNLGNIKDNVKDGAKNLKQGISKEVESMDLEKDITLFKIKRVRPSELLKTS